MIRLGQSLNFALQLLNIHWSRLFKRELKIGLGWDHLRLLLLLLRVFLR